MPVIPFSEAMRLGMVPRHMRPERRRWEQAVRDEDADGRPHPDFFFDRPYLVAHPEREIAEVRGLRWIRAWWECAACGLIVGDVTASLTPGEQEAWAISQVHRHNAERHPRRWARSQQLTGQVALDEARRVTRWGADT